MSESEWSVGVKGVELCSCSVLFCGAWGVRTIKRAGKSEENSGVIIIRIIVPVSHQVSISYDVFIHHSLVCCTVCCDVAVTLRPLLCEAVPDI